MLIRLLILVSITLVSSVLAASDSDDTTVAPELALSFEANQEFELAIDAYQQQVTKAEAAFGPFSEELIDPLMGLARSYFAVSDYDAAFKTNERAQHLTHRNQGVYSIRQLEGIDLMTQIYLSQREIEMADKQQIFSLFISEHHFGKESIDLLPALAKMSMWYMDTGQYRHAQDVLARSRDIIKSSGNTHEPSQIPAIIETAKIKRLRRSCCSHKILQDALAIVDANPDIGNDLRAWIYVELADSYTVRGEAEKAANNYRLAWQAMNEKQRWDYFLQPRPIALSKELEEKSNLRILRAEKNRFGRGKFEPMSVEEKLLLETLPPQEFHIPVNDHDYKVRIRDRMFRHPEDKKTFRVVGHPFQFVHEQLLNILPQSMHDDEDLAKLYVELSFTVNQKGSIREVEVESSNVPAKVRRLMRQVLRKTKFRPRILAGEMITTSQVQLYQTFEP
ncbi:MAG TPA: tetratricopeptide repeat protein [Pseudomonadales bacterium]|jgi:tetratricopeptide (TPR) repeat protein|nr:hypothetical protein [Gammaproteobacteria bacterium]MDP6024367.1 tetratricopeptide repeat protein [Pseudomonadales bacterium]MDP6316564.1 tetratricopeptide repeat protein [Pseudomonadales bacterium]MDP7315197.1 tetratricopeptide repeat protein [Pseudomonadales bacterium]HJL60361.1 tetratricopeptide repeat protein [Pseudomonadales bacterium]|tara:strand:- start:12275 stop:13621 length:1347 start_codon:yes stop_codon:yes gene_type:complete